MTTGDDEALEISQHMRLTISRLRHVVRRANPHEMVTRPQEMALGWLERMGPLTTAQLARWEQVRPQSMGATVADMQTAGLVSKSPDPTDGRRELVSLTAEGRARLRDIVHARDHDFAALLSAQLTSDDLSVIGHALTLLDSLVDP